MKATLEVTKFREALQKVKLVQKSRSLPILSTTKLDFSDSKVTLTTSDLEREIQVVLDGKSDEPFSICVPYKTCEKFMNGDGSLTLELSKLTTVKLHRDSLGECRIQTSELKDFPITKMGDKIIWKQVDAKWFCRMLGYLILGCELDESRPVLTGICLEDGGMASADGFRLYVIKSDKLNFGKRFNVPMITMKIVRQLFGKCGTLEIGLEDKDTPSLVYFKSGDTVITSEITQGTFPRYQQLIPATYQCRASFSVPLMMQRLNMIDKIQDTITRFDFHKTLLNEDECSISAKSEEEYEYALKLPVKIESNELGRIAMNYKYVVDAIKPFSKVNMEIVSPSSPAKFTGDIEELTVVVMPMFIQW
jgi:DNA polymerase-3 subunit beta